MTMLPKINSEGLRLAKLESAARVSSVVNASKEEMQVTKFNLGRHPAIKPPVKGDGTDADGRIGLDTMRRITRDEALELMCHHIGLARMFYEATPEDEVAVLAEAERLLSSGIPGYDGADVVAVRAFLAAMNKFYNDLKKEQGE